MSLRVPYQPQCNDADYIHEDVSSTTENKGVEGNEGLRS